MFTEVWYYQALLRDLALYRRIYVRSIIKLYFGTNVCAIITTSCYAGWGEDAPPSLKVFKSWDPERQDENLSAFRHFNPGIFLEAQAGRKIIGTRIVVDGENPIEGRITHDEIEWGESLDIQ